jgi:hypothetical protein
MQTTKKIKASKIDLGDVLVFGRKRYKVTKSSYNSGGLGDFIWFEVENLRTGRTHRSNNFALDCIIEVECGAESE